MELREILNEQKNRFLEKAPESVKIQMHKATEKLVAEKYQEVSISVGAKLPDFELPGSKGTLVSFSEAIGEMDYLILSYYRGGWCPYCNLELQALQREYENFQKSRAELIAIAPELPEKAEETSEKNQLQFETLSDTGLSYAKKLGITFELDEALKPLYQSFGIDLPSFNGDDSYLLPVPVTLIADKSGKVIYKYCEVDYTVRQEPAELLDILRMRQD